MNQHTRLEDEPIPFIDVAAQRRRLGHAIDDAVARVLGALPVHQGAGSARARGGACGVLRRPARGRLLERHRCAAAGADGQGHRTGRCGDLSRPSRSARPPKWWRWPARRRCSPTSTPRPSTSIRRACERAVATAKQLGLKPRAVIPVDLFGQPADHDAIAAIAAAQGLFVLDDAAQAFGASYKGRRLGTLGDSRPRPAFSRPSRSAATATAARSSPTTTSWPRAAQPPRPRPGHRQIRHCADRPHRPARHHAGGDPDGEAEDLCGRDRGAQRGRGALRRRARQRRDGAARRQRAGPRSGRNTPSGSRRDGATRLRPR